MQSQATTKLNLLKNVDQTFYENILGSNFLCKFRSVLALETAASDGSINLEMSFEFVY